MTRLAVLALLLIASGGITSGCADRASGESDGSLAPEASGGDAAPGGFDAQAWLAEAADVQFDPELDDPSEEQAQRVKSLANDLEGAVDWKRACDTVLDYETGESLHEPIADDEAMWVRGTLGVAMISDTEAVVSVICDYGAYQGSYALIHVRGADATLLQARALGEKGRPLNRTVGTFATPDWADIGAGTLRTLALARGLGDCGTLVTYALPASGDVLDIREVRHRDCGADIPDPLPPPSEWPVVYTAE